MSNLTENYVLSTSNNNTQSVTNSFTVNKLDQFSTDSYEYPLYSDYPTNIQEVVKVDNGNTKSTCHSNADVLSSHFDIFDCPYADSKFAQPLQPLSQSEFELLEDTEPKLYQELNPISKIQSELESATTFENLESPGSGTFVGKTKEPYYYANSKLYQQLQQPTVGPQQNSESLHNIQGQMPNSTRNNMYNLHSAQSGVKWQNKTLSQNIRPLHLPSQPYLANNEYSSKLEINVSNANENNSQDNYSRVIQQNFQSLSKSGNTLSLPKSPVCYGDLGASIRSKFQEKFQNIREVIPENKHMQIAQPNVSSRPKKIYYPHDTIQKVRCKRSDLTDDGISFTFNEKTGNYNLSSKFSGVTGEDSTFYTPTLNDQYHIQETSTVNRHPYSDVKRHPVVNGKIVPDKPPSQWPYKLTPVPSSTIASEPLTWEFNHNTHTNKTDGNTNKQENIKTLVQGTTKQVLKNESKQTQRYVIKSSLKNKISKLKNLSENPATKNVIMLQTSTSNDIPSPTSVTNAINEPKAGKRKYVKSGKYVGRYNREYYMKHKHGVIAVGKPGVGKTFEEMPIGGTEDSTNFDNHNNTSALDVLPDNTIEFKKRKKRSFSKIIKQNVNTNSNNDIVVSNPANKYFHRRPGRPKKCVKTPKESELINAEKSLGDLKNVVDERSKKISSEVLKSKVRKRGRPRKTATSKYLSAKVGEQSSNVEAREDENRPFRKYPRRQLKPKKFNSGSELDDTDDDTLIPFKPRKHRRRGSDKRHSSFMSNDLKPLQHQKTTYKFVDPLKEGLVSDEEDVFCGFEIPTDNDENVSISVKEEINEEVEHESSSVKLELKTNASITEANPVKHSIIESTSPSDDGNEVAKSLKREPEVSLEENCSHSSSVVKKAETCVDSDENIVQVSHPHSCSKCSTSFTSPDLLEKHYKWAHERFSCSMCGEHFTSYYFIRKHKEVCNDQSTTDGERLQEAAPCDECSSNFFSAKALKMHKCKAHQTAVGSPRGHLLANDNSNSIDIQDVDIVNFSCDICLSTFSSKKSLRMHIFKSHKMIISCQKGTLPPKHVEGNVGPSDEQKLSFNIDHQKGDDISFSCGECASAFSTKRALRMHKSKAHKKNIYRCGKCLKKFDQLNSLTVHKRICLAQDRSTFCCAYCNESFMSRKLLHEHWSVHLKERVFKCDMCDYEFTTTTALRRHKLLHTCEKIFRCEICQKSFPLLDILKEHIKAHTEAAVYECNLCNESFGSNEALRAHQRGHLLGKRFDCNECSKTFRWKHALKAHKMTHHAEEQSYICEKCGKKFNNLDSLKKHSFFHSAEFNCPSCLKTFSKYEALKTHMLSHSTTVQHRINLKLHLKSHQKDKLWPCKFCIKFFKSQAHLRRHKRVVHCKAFYEKAITSGDTLLESNEIATDGNRESESERQESVSLGYNSQSDESGEISPGYLTSYPTEEAPLANLSSHDA